MRRSAPSYSATVSAIGQKSSSDDVTLKDADSTDDSSVKTGAQKINQGARLINTRMLQAAAGTGTGRHHRIMGR